jgi:Domain of unknown function (DUF4394)
VNVRTAIAVAEGPAFEPAPSALNGQNIGFDFNPTVDKIRVTSDADDTSGSIPTRAACSRGTRP